MRTDHDVLAARYWAIPAICGLFDLHRDFKDGRFAKVTRLVWASTSVDVYLLYGILTVSGSIGDALETIVTIYRNGAVALGPAAGESVEGRQQILRFLAGEASREARRWSVVLAEWIKGSLDDDVKAATIALVSAMVAHPFTATDVVIDESISVVGPVRKVRLLSESLCTEITPIGTFGTSIYQTGNTPHKGVRVRYMESDLRLYPIEAKTAYRLCIDKVRDIVLQVMMLPIAIVVFLCERNQWSASRIAGEFVDYLPNYPATDRADTGMSALSN